MRIELVENKSERYYQVNGVKCPSVTQVIAYHEDKKFLDDWKSKNPLKANVTSSSARMRGTRIHQALYNYQSIFLFPEKYEKNLAKYRSQVDKFCPEDKNYLESYNDLMRLTIKAEFLETKVAYLAPEDPTKKGDVAKGFGGKLDNVSLLNTKEFVYYKTDKLVFSNPQELFVIDYKNPNKAKKPEHLISYCLQLAAYCAAFNFSTLLTHQLNKALLVVVSPKVTSYYYLSPEKLNKYWSLFKKLLDGYYTKVKYDWKELKEELGIYESDRGYPIINTNNFLPERLELKKKEEFPLF